MHAGVAPLPVSQRAERPLPPQPPRQPPAERRPAPHRHHADAHARAGAAPSWPASAPRARARARRCAASSATWRARSGGRSALPRPAERLCLPALTRRLNQPWRWRVDIGATHQWSDRIRGARPDDAPALAELSTQLGYPSTEQQVRERLGLLEDPERELLVADGPDGLAGFIDVHVQRVVEADPFGEVGGLVVAAPHRGAGLGAALLAAAADWSRARGLERAVDPRQPRARGAARVLRGRRLPRRSRTSASTSTRCEAHRPRRLPRRPAAAWTTAAPGSSTSTRRSTPARSRSARACARCATTTATAPASRARATARRCWAARPGGTPSTTTSGSSRRGSSRRGASSPPTARCSSTSTRARRTTARCCSTSSSAARRFINEIVWAYDYGGAAAQPLAGQARHHLLVRARPGALRLPLRRHRPRAVHGARAWSAPRRRRAARRRPTCGGRPS